LFIITYIYVFKLPFT